jgi:hypothetical protein
MHPRRGEGEDWEKVHPRVSKRGPLCTCERRGMVRKMKKEKTNQWHRRCEATSCCVPEPGREGGMSQSEAREGAASCRTERLRTRDTGGERGRGREDLESFDASQWEPPTPPKKKVPRHSLVSRDCPWSDHVCHFSLTSPSPSSDYFLSFSFLSFPLTVPLFSQMHRGPLSLANTSWGSPFFSNPCAHRPCHLVRPSFLVPADRFSSLQVQRTPSRWQTVRGGCPPFSS